MKPRSLLLAGLAFAGALAPAFAQKVTADILPPQRRDATVEIAAKLTQRPAPQAVSPEMPNPFNPASFNEPDADAGKGTPTAGGRAASAPATPGTPAQPPRPAGDRDILETLAARLTPSGTFVLGGKPLLIIDRNRFEVGTKFIVTYNEQDYELELVAIDRTTFTLRYRGEEITRPIKPVK